MNRLDMAILSALFVLHRSSYIVAVVVGWFIHFLGVKEQTSLRRFSFATFKVFNQYIKFTFGRRRDSLRLIIRQNDVRFNEAVKYYLGDRDNLTVDLRKLDNIPIEEIYEQSNHRLYSYLGIYRQKLFYVISSLLKARLFSIQHTSIVESFVATYTTKYIYLNGGLIYARI